MKQWWTIEMRATRGHYCGQRVFVGRIEATKAEIADRFGPYAEINEQNGSCYIWGRPR